MSKYLKHTKINFDYINFRKFFNISDNKLIYVDNASTSLRPNILIDSYINNLNLIGNLDRSLGIQNTEYSIEQSKLYLANYLNCSKDSIVWSHNSTDSSNFLATSLIEFLKEKKEKEKNICILLSNSNHHSSLLPWIQICEDINIKIIITNNNYDKNELIDYNELNKIVNNNNIVLSLFTSVSNINGLKLNLEKVTSIIKDKHPESLILIDHTQGSIFHKVYFNKSFNLIDGYFGSLHKMFGPTGLGYIVINHKLKSIMKTKRLGGGIIDFVEIIDSNIKWSVSSDIELPGTYNIQAILQISSLIDWWNKFDQIQAYNYCCHIANYFKEQINKLNYNFITINKSYGYIVSISLSEGMEVDFALTLSKNNIISRVGKHCAHIWYQMNNIDSAIRFSFAPHNTIEEIDIIINKMIEFKDVFYE